MKKRQKETPTKRQTFTQPHIYTRDKEAHMEKDKQTQRTKKQMRDNVRKEITLKRGRRQYK